VTGPEGRLIRIVLHGIRGPIEVQGKTYNQEMPGFQHVLTDAEIAALVSFVRRRFGGLNGLTTAAAVSRVRSATQNRAGYWTVDDLLKEPAF
jgi:mono/diheme cytochrome c family protein